MNDHQQTNDFSPGSHNTLNPVVFSPFHDYSDPFFLPREPFFRYVKMQVHR